MKSLDQSIYFSARSLVLHHMWRLVTDSIEAECAEVVEDWAESVVSDFVWNTQSSVGGSVVQRLNYYDFNN